MDSAVWTSFCGCTGKSHDNLIQCPDCHARNPQISYSVSSSTSAPASVRREVIDLRSDSPPRTKAAVSVAASRFPIYNREHGAETHRQAHFAQRSASVRSARRQTSASSLSTSGSYRAIVTFSLLQYELVDGLPRTINYQGLGTYDQILELLSS